MDEKKVLVLKRDNTTLSTGCKCWPWEKPRNCLYDDIDICIMITHNIKIYIYIYIYIYTYEVFDDKILMSYKLWIVVRIIYMKGLFPHPSISEFHLLSYLTPPPPLFPFIDTLEGFLE